MNDELERACRIYVETGKWIRSDHDFAWVQERGLIFKEWSTPPITRKTAWERLMEESDD